MYIFLNRNSVSFHLTVWSLLILAARTNHSDNDCLLVAVLSHGETNIIYAKDTHYKPDCLWSPFTADKCPTLAGMSNIHFC